MQIEEVTSVDPELAASLRVSFDPVESGAIGTESLRDGRLAD